MKTGVQQDFSLCADTDKQIIIIIINQTNKFIQGFVIKGKRKYKKNKMGVQGGPPHAAATKLPKESHTYLQLKKTD